MNLAAVLADPPVGLRAIGMDGFNFTERMRDVVTDMVKRLDELQHIDVSQVAFSFAQARKRTRHGIHASLTPMRFEDGAEVTVRHGRPYKVQRLYDRSGREMLYILNFYLPRFMDVEFDEKLVTILHELWHISPTFNGDLRRHPGRCYAHTSSQAEYDAQMKVLANRWLGTQPDESVYGFLRLSFGQLARRTSGRVYGRRVPHPKLIAV